jgi:hypothetical protein
VKSIDIFLSPLHPDPLVTASSLRRNHKGRAVGLGFLALCLLGGIALATPALAQEARDYVPADFARFAPRNANQMLGQVPGFTVRENNGDRGLGQATANVLINGQRVSTKNGIQDELSRYTAESVIRIEIRDASAFDVAGLSGLVANVVVQSNRITGQFSYRPEFRDHVTKPILRRGDISINGALGPLEYSLSAANNAFRGGAGGPTSIYDSSLTLIETREERWSNGGDQPKFNAGLALRDWNGITANLALEWRATYSAFYERGIRQGNGLADRNRFVDNDENSEFFDVSGDVEFGVGPGSLKLIGLNRTSHKPTSQQVITDYIDLTPDQGSRNQVLADTLERVLRAEYRFSWGGDWQLSVENAFNSLENVSRLFTLTPGVGFTEIPLTNGTGNVQEDRYDAALSYGRDLWTGLSLRATAAVEQSTLQQLGAGGKTREFFRPKGQLVLTWQAQPETSIALKLERQVGQIGFGDFLASVNLNNNTANAGNPNLVPPQTWLAELETAHDMGAWGNTTLRLYARSIEDIIDTIPIGPTGESIGNLPSAYRYGMDWKFTLNFDPLGWEGAKLDGRLQYQESEVRDPLTGQKRQVSNDMRQAAFFNLRWDIPGTDWATGGFWEYYEQYYGYRLTEFGRQWEGPVWAGIFVEHKDIFGLVGRIQINNLFDTDSTWNRTVYAGRRTDPISFIEYRNRPIGHIFSFTISGTF